VTKVCVGTGSRLYPMVGFGINSTEPSDSAAAVFVRFFFQLIN
jgi:hypothetical protein